MQIVLSKGRIWIWYHYYESIRIWPGRKVPDPDTHTDTDSIQCCGAGALRAEELKLNYLPELEPKLRIAAPAPFIYQRLKEIL